MPLGREKNMKLIPQFYPNLKDDNHCLQASIMMVLNTLLAQKTDWEEVNKITQYQNGLYSWSVAGVLAIAKRIPGTKLISDLDYRQFAEKGEVYLKKKWEKLESWYNLQKNNASPGFRKEQGIAKDFLNQGIFEHKKIRLQDIEKLLEKNFLICVIDSGRLAGRNLSYGHFVLVYDQNNGNLSLHDPGIPPKQEWKVLKNKFMEAIKGEVIAIPTGRFIVGKKIGRNDPCWCGSGKKFKKCHYPQLG